MIRLHLLADRIVRAHEEGVDDAVVLWIVPARNVELRHRVTSPLLRERLAQDDVETTYRQLLRKPDSFKVSSPEALLQAFDTQRFPHLSEAMREVRARYSEGR